VSADIDIPRTQDEAKSDIVRKPGRPRAIPGLLIIEVLRLYRAGNGYRSIARSLESDYGLSVDYSSVRRAIKRAAEAFG
jgi:hypothetical protein